MPFIALPAARRARLMCLVFPVHAIKAETGNSFPDYRMTTHSRDEPPIRRAENPLKELS